MKIRKALLLSVVPWVVCISTLHAWLNHDLFKKRATEEKQFRVGFLPVT